MMGDDHMWWWWLLYAVAVMLSNTKLSCRCTQYEYPTMVPPTTQPPVSTRPGILDPSFAEYLSQFIDQVGAPKQDARLFLHRNLPSVQGGHDTLTTYPPTLLTRCLTRNGLECKIACASSKVSYVLDTEDLFFRAKAPHTPNEALREARAARFREKVESLCRAIPAAGGSGGVVAEGGAGEVGDVGEDAGVVEEAEGAAPVAMEAQGAVE